MLNRKCTICSTSAKHIERPGKQARSVLCHTVSSPSNVQAEREHHHCTLCWSHSSCLQWGVWPLQELVQVQSLCRFHLRMRTARIGNLAQAGYYLCMNYVSVFCEHVLLLNRWSCILATLSHDCIVALNILVYRILPKISPSPLWPSSSCTGMFALIISPPPTK